MARCPILVSEKLTHFHGCQMATSNSVKQHKLRKLLATLSTKEGHGKEFISLYIPGKTPIEQVIATLKEEADCVTTKFGVSREVSGRLQDALKNVIQHLKLQREIPENGLALFAGLSDYVWRKRSVKRRRVSPPEPITTYLYAVNNHFRLEPLREMLKSLRIVGLIAMDSKEASFGVLNGEQLRINRKYHVGDSGKIWKGRVSQRRY